jgi:serine/threonine protein phosphatase PrpC
MLAASQRGRSHAHKGDAREDDFFIATGEGWCIAIVADGAGSAKYSRYGSQLICHTIGQFLVKVLAQPIPVHMQNMELEVKRRVRLSPLFDRRRSRGTTSRC